MLVRGILLNLRKNRGARSGEDALGYLSGRGRTTCVVQDGGGSAWAESVRDPPPPRHSGGRLSVPSWRRISAVPGDAEVNRSCMSKSRPAANATSHQRE